MKRVTCVVSVLIIFWPGILFGLFIDNYDATFTDTDTNLMWQKIDLGKINWNDAELNSHAILAGYNDWRMPSFSELFSLRSGIVLPGPIGTFLVDGIFECHTYYYWTTQARPDYPHHAVISFYRNPIGSSHWSDDRNPNYVRYVRNPLPSDHPAPIPDPATGLLLGLGCLIVLPALRRKLKK